MQLQRHKTDEKTSISYTLIGDYYIPNVTLPKTKCKQNIGVWGMRHKQYLMKNKKVLYNILIAQGKLYSYLLDIDKQSEKMFSQLIVQMGKQEGITEKLKEENQMLWVRRMNAIHEAATEIVNRNLIYI